MVLVATLLKLTFSCVAPEEFRCEEAIAKLEDCCGGAFDPHAIACERDLSCKYNQAGVRPEINERAASCLFGRSCADIRARQMCASLSDPRIRENLDGKSNVERIACAP